MYCCPIPSGPHLRIIFGEKVDTLIIHHGWVALTVYCCSAMPTTPWPVLDGLLTLSKLPSVLEKMFHMQVTHQTWYGTKGGWHNIQVLNMSKPTNMAHTHSAYVFSSQLRYATIHIHQVHNGQYHLIVDLLASNLYGMWDFHSAHTVTGTHCHRHTFTMYSLLFS